MCVCVFYDNNDRSTCTISLCSVFSADHLFRSVCLNVSILYLQLHTFGSSYIIMLQTVIDITRNTLITEYDFACGLSAG